MRIFDVDSEAEGIDYDWQLFAHPPCLYDILKYKVKWDNL